MRAKQMNRFGCKKKNVEIALGIELETSVLTTTNANQ